MDPGGTVRIDLWRWTMMPREHVATVPSWPPSIGSRVPHSRLRLNRLLDPLG